MGLAAVLLGANDPTEPLGLLLARAEGARDLDGHARPGQVDGEVRDLGHHQCTDISGAEGVVEALTLAHRCRAGDDGGVQVLGDLGELIHVLADDEGRLALVAGQEGVDDRQLARGGGRQAVALLGLGGRVGHALTGVEGQAHLGADRRGDPALVLQVLPGGVVALGADEAEDLVLAAVLAHEGRRQAQAAARLQVRGHPEDRGGQEVDLVVDDEPPVVGVQQVQVRVDAFAASGEHLVGGDRDGADLLARAGVLADLLLGQGGEADELLLPLTRRDRVGDQDERRRRALGHGGGAHEGLAGPAGQDDHA